MKDEVMGFYVDFVADSGDNYLILKEKGSKKIDIIDYQVEMILQNRLSGIVGFYIKKKDNEVQICYRITGLVSLKNYLFRQKIEPIVFVHILEKMLNVILDSNRYMLSEDAFILEEDLIYIHTETGEVSLIYVPIENKESQAKNLKSCIINLILQTPYFDTADKVVQELLNVFREDHITVKDLLKRINSINNNEKPSELRPNTFNIEGMKSDFLSTINNVTDEKVDDSKQKKTGTKSTMSKGEIGTGLARKGFARKIILLVLAILAITAAIISNYPGCLNIIFKNITITKYSYIGAGAIIAILSVIYYLGIYNKDKNLYVNDADNDINDNLITNLNENLICNLNNNSYAVSEFVAAALDTQKDETVILEPSDETVFLSGPVPVLKSVQNSELIMICKKDFIIGRNEEMCDYALKNKSVGRVHARITTSDNSFFVTDLDSKNGTFLNGNRLVSNKPYQINNDDKLILASLEFTFLLQ